MDSGNDPRMNRLKRPRRGSLDDEPDRQPPGRRQAQPPPELSSSPPISSSMFPDSRTMGDLLCPSEGDNFGFQSPGNLEDSNVVVLTLPSSAPIGFIPSQTSSPAGLSEPSTSISSDSHLSQTFITGGNHFENYGNLRYNSYHQTISTSHDPQWLTRLHKHAADNAIHTSFAVDNQGLCLPGTRAFTLQHLQSLVTSVDNKDPDVIWMHGPPGAGKSAIMRTMANALAERGVLLGSFFFYQTDTERNTATPFIPTMALQSLTSFPATRSSIQVAIQTNPTIFSQSLRYQCNCLLETPLKSATARQRETTPQPPLVIVIDGLDECTDANRQVEIINVMRRLASNIRHSTKQKRRVKILIASRPEKPIKDAFVRGKNRTTVIELNPSDANIDLFYDTRLDEIRYDKHLPESWPSPQQIKWLKKKTSGQYSFAHLSMGFLAGGDPFERFKMLETGVATHGLEPFEAIDALYATIFRQIPPEMADNALLLVRFWLLAPSVATRFYDNFLRGQRLLSPFPRESGRLSWGPITVEEVLLVP